jgi:GNAT superfamily N-acetyltransferase
MRYAAKLVLRGGQRHEAAAVSEVLAGAFAGGDVDQWLGATAETRLAHFRTVVDAAFDDGNVRVADEDGTLVGAALWFPRPAVPRPRAEPEPTPRADRPDGPAERFALLERLLAERHPVAPAHHHLAYLGVRPDRQRQGIGSYLLIGHHAYLHVSRTPAYLEANDPRNRALYLRHGYTDVGAPIVLPSGIPIWPMWRPPTPAGSVPGVLAPRVAFLSYQ